LIHIQLSGRAQLAAPPGNENGMCIRKIHDGMVAGWRIAVNRERVPRSLTYGLGGIVVDFLLL
jgi:hypothetical protein